MMCAIPWITFLLCLALTTFLTASPSASSGGKAAGAAGVAAPAGGAAASVLGAAAAGSAAFFGFSFGSFAGFGSSAIVFPRVLHLRRFRLFAADHADGLARTFAGPGVGRG